MNYNKINETTVVCFELKVVHPRKLDLRQKQIIFISRIAILLLKGSFERIEINFQEKNLRNKKINHSTNFIIP